MSKLSSADKKLYCEIAKNKFRSKFDKAIHDDFDIDHKVNCLVYKKAGLLPIYMKSLKIQKDAKRLRDLLNVNLTNEKREARIKLSEYNKVQDELDDVCIKIKLSSCPENILTILNEIK